MTEYQETAETLRREIQSRLDSLFGDWPLIFAEDTVKVLTSYRPAVHIESPPALDMACAIPFSAGQPIQTVGVFEITSDEFKADLASKYVRGHMEQFVLTYIQRVQVTGFSATGGFGFLGRPRIFVRVEDRYALFKFNAQAFGAVLIPDHWKPPSLPRLVRIQ